MNGELERPDRGRSFEMSLPGHGNALFSRALRVRWQGKSMGSHADMGRRTVTTFEGEIFRKEPLHFEADLYGGDAFLRRSSLLHYAQRLFL